MYEIKEKARLTNTYLQVKHEQERSLNDIKKSCWPERYFVL